MEQFTGLRERIYRIIFETDTRAGRAFKVLAPDPQQGGPP